jgi:hypothetical protein
MTLLDILSDMVYSVCGGDFFMSAIWTDAEKADAFNERRNNQPFQVIADLLNKKYHDGRPVRSETAVSVQYKRILRATQPDPIAEEVDVENTDDGLLGLDTSQIPQIVLAALSEMPELAERIPAEIQALIGNPPQEPKRINSAEEAKITDKEIEEHILKVAAQQPLSQRATGIVKCPDIKIPETGWFGIAFTSDWHIGSIWTELQTILYEAKIIAATPGLFTFFGGDSIDGGIPMAPHGGILNEQILPAHWQRAIARYIFRLIGPNMKAAATGCHEWWSIDAADHDFIHDVVKETNCVYLGGGSKYRLVAEGGGEWNGVYLHKASGHSIYNDFHPCTVRAQRHEQNADIICVAHEHLSGTSIQVVGELRRYFARTGARKAFDKYASKIGSDSRRDDLGVPVLLLHGTHGRKVKGQWIEGIPMAAVILTMLRQADPFAYLAA